MLRRLVRAIRRRLPDLRRGGIKSAQKLDRKSFLSLFDPGLFSVDPSSNPAAAESDLLAHFARRIEHQWPGVPLMLTDLRIDLERMSDQEIVARADAALAHDLHPSGVRPLIRPGNRIDWSANPADTGEWRLMLHRHAWWALWAAAYQVTDDEKYAQAFVAQLMDWLRSNPMPAHKSEHRAPWRLMECGLRLRLSWIPSFGVFYRSASFDDDAKLAMLRGIYDHCHFLQTYFTNRNHLVRESNGLVAGALAFPEYSEAKTWLDTGVDRLDRELRAQVNPDGSHIEMSIGYQWLAVDEFEVTRSLLGPPGIKLPHADLDATLERMCEYLANVIRPDRRFPQLNDGFILWDAARLANAARDLGRRDLEFAATTGESGVEPKATSRSFPNAGLHIMRSGWKPDAAYLAFDTGPYGGPHGHEDKLAFELFAQGASFFVDPGSYTYRPTDPFRQYFVGSQGHNTVLVDGKSQVRRWDARHLVPEAADETFGEWQANDNFDWARGRYDEGYAEFSITRPDGAVVAHDAAHTREILFAKPDFWVIVDDLDADDEHDYTSLFHLAPGVEVVELGPGAAIVRAPHNDAALLLKPICADRLGVESACGEESPIQGWYSDEHHRKQPSTTLSCQPVA